jgi:hypothetical protein
MGKQGKHPHKCPETSMKPSTILDIGSLDNHDHTNQNQTTIRLNQVGWQQHQAAEKKRHSKCR